MSIKMNMAPNGRVCIPADVRARLGVKDGGALFLEEDGDGFKLTSHAQRIKRVQRLVAKAMEGKPKYTVDQFLAERRADWGEED
jgi:AbrB family looped-hinge helix DNA binding protein